MKITFSRDAMQDMDGPRRVMRDGLLHATVQVTAEGLPLPDFYDVIDVTDEGLLLQAESETTFLVRYEEIKEVLYL